MWVGFDAFFVQYESETNIPIKDLMCFNNNHKFRKYVLSKI